VRPTSDKMRETLFNILSPVIQGAIFVDAYAGTGAVGIEALSRGARHAIFIEKNRDAANLIKSNLAALKIEARARVIPGSAALYLGKIGAGIVFIDPPYPNEREYQASFDALESNTALESNSQVIVQHSVRFALAEEQGPFRRFRMIKQGENALSFFRLL
jgi:16S rRNA (guanine966-N2)-methyltransferase